MSTLLTLGEALAEVEALLRAHGREEPRLKAELLAADVMKIPRLELFMVLRHALPDGDVARLRTLAGRLAEGEPLQYVLGWTDFFGRRFKCDPRALIPRPETEELVETVLACGTLWEKPGCRMVDVGTGTGCIALTISLERPLGRYVAVDVSRDALALAHENAGLLGAGNNIDFRLNSLLDGFEANSLDALVSNPPYIAAGDIEGLAREVAGHEPRLALDGGLDGLEVVRRLVKQAFVVLRSGGWIFMEIGEDQAGRVKTLLEDSGFDSIGVRRDLAGHDRIISGCKSA